jgi:hypothetical protein
MCVSSGSDLSPDARNFPMERLLLHHARPRQKPAAGPTAVGFISRLVGNFSLRIFDR